MLRLLEQVENRFSNDYETTMLNGQRCFVAPNGTVFFFIVLEQLRSLLVEYADDIQGAKSGIFDDGDLMDVDQSFEELIAEIREELQREAA